MSLTKLLKWYRTYQYLRLCTKYKDCNLYSFISKSHKAIRKAKKHYTWAELAHMYNLLLYAAEYKVEPKHWYYSGTNFCSTYHMIKVRKEKKC